MSPDDRFAITQEGMVALNTDKLDAIFIRQKQLSALYKSRGHGGDREGIYGMEEVRLLALALMVETGEMLQKLNWKPWKKTKKFVDRLAVLEELADMMHFYVEMCVVLGFSAGDISAAYHAKSDVNEKRVAEGY